MIDTLITGFIEAASRLGLRYDFLRSGYELQMWADGFGVTIKLVLVTIPASLLVGAVLAGALTSGRPALTLPARAFVEGVRNTPTIVQLMFAFLVLNMLISEAVGGARHNPLTPFFWVVFVVAVNIGAYHAEALRAGIEAVPANTMEAARSIGFSSMQILLYVSLPLAVRTALPAIVNNLTQLVKATTVGSAIAVGEITYASIMIWTQRDNVIELMLVILVFFFLANQSLSLTGRWLERRLALPGYGL